MPAVLKSEAYYLTHDPVIGHWESAQNLHRFAEYVRIRLKYTGRACTPTLTIAIRENSALFTTADGRTFTLEREFVLRNLEKVLAKHRNLPLFQKYLERNSVCRGPHILPARRGQLAKTGKG